MEKLFHEKSQIYRRIFITYFCCEILWEYLGLKNTSIQSVASGKIMKKMSIARVSSLRSVAVKMKVMGLLSGCCQQSVITSTSHRLLLDYHQNKIQNSLVANSNSSNYSSSSVRQSVTQSVTLCDIIFLLYILWLDLNQYNV